MLDRCKPGGHLHGESSVQRRVGGFILTEGVYPPAMAIERHDHELASICVVLAGGYEERYGRRSRRVDPGVVIAHPAGEHHDECHDPVHTRLLTIEIEPGMQRDLPASLRVFDEAWHRTDYGAAASAYKLCRELTRVDSAVDLVIESIAMAMLADLERSRVPDAAPSAWLWRVRDCLEAEFRHPPDMRALGEIAGVHPVHLARAFRRRFGCSIGSYVRRLQVGKAALLLEDERQSLASIAYDAGFADQSHMTRRVANEIGMTPGAWRRRRGASPNA